MKSITVNTKELQSQMSKILKLKPCTSDTIIEYIKLSATSSGLHLAYTNLDVTLYTNVDPLSVSGSFEVCLHRDTYKIISKFKSETVTLELDDDSNAINNLVIRSGTIKITPALAAVEDFPELPEFDYEAPTLHCIDALQLSALSTCASKSEARPALRGIYISTDLIATTDGHRAQYKRVGTSLINAQEYILPLDLVPVLKAVKGTVKLSTLSDNTKKHVSIQCDGMQIVVRVVNAQFPGMDRIIPNNPRSETFEHKALQEQLSIVSGNCSDRFNSIKYNITSDGEVTLTSINPERGDVSAEIVPVVTNCHGRDATYFVVNRKYLQECVNGQKSDIEVTYKDPLNVIEISNDKFDGYTLIMTLRV